MIICIIDYLLLIFVDCGSMKNDQFTSQTLASLTNTLSCFSFLTLSPPLPQLCRSQCASLRTHASSLELHRSSLTSDLSRLRGESASFLSACALLAGALKHAHRRLLALSTQKALLSRRLAEREVLEEEVRALAGALGGEEEEDEEEEGRRRAARRWRRSVCVVLAARRWSVLAKQTTVLFRVERGGGGLAVSVCGGAATATRKGEDGPSTGRT